MLTRSQRVGIAAGDRAGRCDAVARAIKSASGAPLWLDLKGLRRPHSVERQGRQMLMSIDHGGERLDRGS